MSVLSDVVEGPPGSAASTTGQIGGQHMASVVALIRAGRE